MTLQNLITFCMPTKRRVSRGHGVELFCCESLNEEDQLRDCGCPQLKIVNTILYLTRSLSDPPHYITPTSSSCKYLLIFNGCYAASNYSAPPLLMAIKSHRSKSLMQKATSVGCRKKWVHLRFQMKSLQLHACGHNSLLY